MATQAVANEVISIAELCEMIILELPAYIILTKVTRVSRTWKQMVEASPKIQHLLFIRPSATTARWIQDISITNRYPFVNLTNLSIDEFDFFNGRNHHLFATGQYTPKPEHDSRNLVAYGKACPVVVPTDLNPILLLNDTQSPGPYDVHFPTSFNPQAVTGSWEQMLISQPPPANGIDVDSVLERCGKRKCDKESVKGCKRCKPETGPNRYFSDGKEELESVVWSVDSDVAGKNVDWFWTRIYLTGVEFPSDEERVQVVENTEAMAKRL